MRSGRALDLSWAHGGTGLRDARTLIERPNRSTSIRSQRGPPPLTDGASRKARHVERVGGFSLDMRSSLVVAGHSCEVGPSRVWQCDLTSEVLLTREVDVPHSLVLSDSTVGRADGRTFVFIRSSTDVALDAASWGMSDNVGLGTDARASGPGCSPHHRRMRHARAQAAARFHIRCFTATLLHRNRVGITILDGFDELTALVPEIEQIPQEARF
jgi:hypothetical protein